MRYVIIGSGPAGIAGAKAIRKRDKNAEVIITTGETDAPYMRPLLPGLISGEVDIASISDPHGEGLAGEKIEIRFGKEAKGIDAAKRSVTFSDGSFEPYDRLLIATGGTPILPPPLLRHPGPVMPLNTLRDALRIRERSRKSDRAVVYGPGFLAIEACRAMRTAGQEVVWFKPDLPRHGYPITSGEFESRFMDDLRNRGVTIREGVDIAELEGGDKNRVGVRGTDGETVQCAIIVAATERLPSVDFLEGSGVDCNTGVLVDDYLRTSAPDVYAAGDCAEIFDKSSKKRRINFGWRSAIKQGQLAGENMAGRDTLYIRRSEDYLWLIFGPPVKDRMK